MASADTTTNRSESEQRPTAPTISLPKGGGAIRGIGEKFAANPVTGTGSMTVPIATSPGRSGFGPQLSLSYDSGSGNGPFGFGWNLSLPSIIRKTDKGLPQYLDAVESDVFILSGAEDLVPVLQPDGSRHKDDVSAPGFTIHRYRPRVEGLFARIERWTERATGEIHWRSITRENVTTLYGRDNNSRVFDPADPVPAHPTRVFRWLICTSYDDKGNAVVYDYAAEDAAGVNRSQASERNRARTANRYLKRVRYGNRVSRLVQADLSKATWLFELVFDYEEGHYEDLPLGPGAPDAQYRFVRASWKADGTWAFRPDPFSLHRAGFEVRSYRRCRRVLMFHRFAELNQTRLAELADEPCLVRAIEFDYRDIDYSKPTTIEGELGHQGSTRFASFIQSITQSGFVRDDSKAVVVRGGVKYITYTLSGML
ncbi:MAG: SpvB/TcaC N-terminal domain-containing protein [Candidatus Binatia bacterium]